MTSTVVLIAMAAIIALLIILSRVALSQNSQNSANINVVNSPGQTNVVTTPASPIVETPVFVAATTLTSRYAPAVIPKNFREEIHFIHVPKCGGTSMTAVLRQVMCDADPINHVDCCTNPGFCDFHSNRKCSIIKGCINHFPNRPFIYTSIPSITMLREPVSRLAHLIISYLILSDFFQLGSTADTAQISTFSKYVLSLKILKRVARRRLHSISMWICQSIIIL